MNETHFGPGCPWYGMFEQFGPPNVKWCEETLCAIVNEPANAWSNLPFIFVGLFFWNRMRKQGHAESAWLAMTAVVMGFFSFVYHATNNAFTQYLDFFGMYVFELYILALNLERMGAFDAKARKWVYGTAVIVMTFATPLFREAGFPIQALIGIFVLGIIGTEFSARARGSLPENGKVFIAMAASFAIAITCSALDHKRVVCDPTNHFVQGHALWHCFSAIGTAFAIKYYAAFRFPVMRRATA